jgi:general secretion pathway protein K
MTRRGQMLLVVLWVLGCLTLVVGALATSATHELRLSRVPLGSLQRKAIAEAGLQQAARVVAQDTAESPLLDTLQEPWATGLDAEAQPIFERIPVGAGVFSVQVMDEERKLPLNAATPEQLSRLLEAVAPDAEATALAAAIVDWRDDALGTACDGASPPCHNGPFESVEELRLVPGMTAEVFDAVEPFVTIYGSGLVNVNTASADVLSAIGCDADAMLRQRDETPFTEPPPDCAGTAVASTAFSVEADAELPQASGTAHVRGVIDRDGRVLSWSPR